MALLHAFGWQPGLEPWATHITYSGFPLFTRKGWVRRSLEDFAVVNSLSYVPPESMCACRRGLGIGGKVNFYVNFSVFQRTIQSASQKN